MKRLTYLATLALALTASTGARSADSYPVRPITLIVPFAPGGATDALARHFADRMSKDATQNIIVENVAGAGGTIGATRVAKAKPDGYTFLVGHIGYMAAAPGLYKQLAYDPVADFEGVARLPDTPMVLVTGSGSRFKTIQSLIEFSRQNNGGLNLGNAGVGSAGHLVAALFSTAMNSNVTHISYKGNAPAITDLVAGRIDGIFDQSNTALSHVNGGRVSALATTAKQRLSQMPDVPTMIEAGLPELDVATWYGIYAPKHTPPDRIKWMYERFKDAMNDQSFTSKLVEQGYMPLAPELSTGEALAKHTRREGQLWQKVIAEAGIPSN